jgi:hypothetical protein
MKIRMLSLLIAALLVTSQSLCQTFLEDADGESTLKISASPFLYGRVNTSDESVSIGYSRQKRIGTDIQRNMYNYNMMYGTDIKVKLTEGIGSFVDGNEFKPGVSLNGYFGWLGARNVNAEGAGLNLMSFYFTTQLSYNKFVLLDTAFAIKNEGEEVGGQMLFQFNKRWGQSLGTKKSAYYMFGIGTGYKRSSNYDDLADGSYDSVYASNNLAVIKTSEDGKIGSLKHYNIVPLNIDFAFVPCIGGENLVGFNIFSRISFFKESGDVKSGFGVFFNKKNRPSAAIGGIAWQFNDMTNDKKEADILKKSTVFAYVGFTLD